MRVQDLRLDLTHIDDDYFLISIISITNGIVEPNENLKKKKEVNGKLIVLVLLME
jgi:hypothetical protein